MEPKKVGRTLGIGVRVASNMLRERVARASVPSPVTVLPQVRPPSAARRLETAKRGARAFGAAFLGPFTHAGSILWLEITGLFFALFAVFFVQGAYRVHSSWRQGPEHQHFFLYAALAVGFGWFSFSSFLRAYRKSKRGRGEGLGGQD